MQNESNKDLSTGLAAKEIKSKILDEELSRHTERLLEGIESDIEGDFNPLEFDRFWNQRQSVILSAEQFANNEIEDLKEAWDKFHEIEESDRFKKNRDDGIVSYEHFKHLKRLAFKESNLRKHFGLMWYGDHRSLVKTKSAVDQQIMLKQGKDFTEEIRGMISDSHDLGEEIAEGIRQADLERHGVKEEELEEVENRFESRIEELEERLEKVEQETASNIIEMLRKEDIGKPKDLYRILHKATDLNQTQKAKVIGVEQSAASNYESSL